MSIAGELGSRLTLKAPSEMPDEQGGVSRTYATVRKVWARVVSMRPREGVAADAAGAAQRVRITVRAPLELTLRHRFKDGPQIYRITGFRDEGDVIEIDAELRLS